MNIFEYDGEEFDKKLDEIFENINIEELKKELVECGLIIKQEVYNINNEIDLIENNIYSTVDSQQISIELHLKANIELNKQEREEEEWMEELALAA